MRFKLFGKAGTPVYSSELGHTIKELLPLSGHAAANTMFISLPAGDILTLVERYIAAMETEESEHWCRCEWMIHPDDVSIKKGHCRECELPKVHQIHTEADLQYHRFRGIRKRKGDTDATCPVHTREGLIIYFFEWVFSSAARG